MQTSNAQSPLRSSLLLTGAIIVVLSQWLLQALPLERRANALWFTALGSLLFLIPIISILRNNDDPGRIEKIIERMANWLHVPDWQVIPILISPFLSWIAFMAAGEGQRMIDPVLAILAWVLAIGTSILGCFKKKLQIKPTGILLPLGLTVIAFLVRGLGTDRIPFILTGDEGSAGIAAVRFLKGEVNNPFVSSWYSFPALYFYIQALSIRIFGQTTQALRLTSALAGALTVTAIYFVGSIMFDRRTGLVAAIFLTAYNFHVNFSRIGLNNIWDGLWYTIVIGALWYGWEHEEIKAFIVSGFCLGIAQYFYPSGRALLIPIFVWLIIASLLNREKFKSLLPSLLLMLIVSVTIVLPLGLFYLHHPNEFMAPFARVSLFGPVLDGLVKSTGNPAWLIVLTQIGKSFGGFTYLPIKFWYEPGTPLLLPLPASFFLFGILILIIRDHKTRSLLLALWIVTFGLIGGLSESTPASQRYIAVAPVCALLIGYGVSETAGILEKLWPKLNRILYRATIAIAILMAVSELNFYFRVYTPKFAENWSHNNGVIAQELADYLQGKPSDLTVIFFGQPQMGYYSIPSLQYLVPNIKGMDATEPWNPQSSSDIQGKKDLVFVFLPGNEGAINSVEASYPTGQSHMKTASDGKPLYWYYEYLAP